MNLNIRGQVIRYPKCRPYNVKKCFIKLYNINHYIKNMNLNCNWVAKELNKPI